MPKVTFKFDKEKDLYNIWETCNKQSNWFDNKKNVSKDILDICEGKKFEESKKQIEEKRRNMYSSGFIEIYINSLQKAWDKINDEFFKRLEKIMKAEICYDKFTGYVTTVHRCPYDYKEHAFMVSFLKDILNALKTVGHEIMHIQFHRTYWGEIEKQVGHEKTHDLKEALTVLLNLEFGNLWFVFDVGYEPHKELRKFIEQEWKKNPDFDVLMEKCVEYLKTK